MKRAFSPLFLVAAMLASARADLTIVQQVEGAGPVAQVTMKIKGDKARIEATPEMTMIYDGKSGETLNVVHGQKMVMRTTAAQTKMAAAAIAGNVVEMKAPPEKVKVVPSGQKETINGYETEEYIATGTGYKASYWVARTYPQGEAILKQLQMMTPDALNGVLATPDLRDFPGLPLRTNVTMGETKIVTTITAVKTDPLPDSEFGIPEGYKEMKIPDMSSLLGGKPDAAKDAKPSASPKP